MERGLEREPGQSLHDWFWKVEKKLSNTACSVTTGKGVRGKVFRCFERIQQALCLKHNEALIQASYHTKLENIELGYKTKIQSCNPINDTLLTERQI